MKIFDIQRFSIQDGPGVRTSIFMKGCPLRCIWCHNPESVLSKTQILYYEDKCTGCGECAVVCPMSANHVANGRHWYDRTKCIACGKCARACTQEAFRIAGYEITPDELVEKVVRDRIFYEETGGGVTFTGGEPFAQFEELCEAAKSCRNENIHTAIETSLMTPWKNIEALDSFIDLWICDMKACSAELHKRGTGTDNTLILGNLKKLLETRIEKVWVRIPVIPGFNDMERELKNIAGFLKAYRVQRVELMPYHDIGAGKYTALGQAYALENTPCHTRGQVEGFRRILRENSVCNVR